MDSDLNNTRSEVMISHLPLLFSKGEPTCLEKMTLPELQTFVPFMLKCSLGCDVANWADIPRPSWWPPTLPFSTLILHRNEHQEQLRPKLKDLVQRCYVHFQCDYLLHFCDQLICNCRNGFTYRNNNDGTTSLLERLSGRLLVSFRNENREYDMVAPHQVPSSPRKTLLQCPPTIQQCDIYLCDNCDQEFTSLQKIKEHERVCGPQGDTITFPHSPSSDNSDREDNESVDQTRLLSYLGLHSTDGLEHPKGSPVKSTKEVKRRFGSSYLRYVSIDISSPLGQNIRTKSGLGSQPNVLLCIERYERFCIQKKNSPRPGPANRWPVTYKNDISHHSLHQYCFTWMQKRERLKTLATGLDRASRILKKRCKDFRIVLKRVSQAEIDSWSAKKEAAAPSPPRLVVAAWAPPMVVMQSPTHPSEPIACPAKDDIVVIDLVSDDDEPPPGKLLPEGENNTANNNNNSRKEAPKNGSSHWPQVAVNGGRNSDGRKVLGPLHLSAGGQDNNSGVASHNRRRSSDGQKCSLGDFLRTKYLCSVEDQRNTLIDQARRDVFGTLDPAITARLCSNGIRVRVVKNSDQSDGRRKRKRDFSPQPQPQPINKELRKLAQDECKELKAKGLDLLLCGTHGARRSDVSSSAVPM